MKYLKFSSINFVLRNSIFGGQPAYSYISKNVHPIFRIHRNFKCHLQNLKGFQNQHTRQKEARYRNSYIYHLYRTLIFVGLNVFSYKIPFT